MTKDWSFERRLASDDNDIHVGADARELVMFMGGNGDWYLDVVEPGKKPWHAVRIRTSGGAAATCPGLVYALSLLYKALPEADAVPGYPPRTPRVTHVPTIVKPPKPKRVKCDDCKATIEYFPENVDEYHGTDYGGGPDGYKRVKCPRPGCKGYGTIESW